MVAIYNFTRQKASESSRNRGKMMTSAVVAAAAAKPTMPLSAKIGWGLSGLAILFLGTDAGAKILVPAMMTAYTPPQLKIPTDVGFYRLLGSILAICTALYAVPRTAVLGAILLTGYLGGAVATHLSAGSPLVSNTLFRCLPGPRRMGRPLSP
jgi:hypothetical protein